MQPKPPRRSIRPAPKPFEPAGPNRPRIDTAKMRKEIRQTRKALELATGAKYVVGRLAAAKVGPIIGRAVRYGSPKLATIAAKRAKQVLAPRPKIYNSGATDPVVAPTGTRRRRGKS